MFRHVGVEPAGASVLMLKSSVHFRADFGPMAARVLLVEAPGPNPADPGPAAVYPPAAGRAAAPGPGLSGSRAEDRRAGGMIRLR